MFNSRKGTLTFHFWVNYPFKSKTLFVSNLFFSIQFLHHSFVHESVWVRGCQTSPAELTSHLKSTSFWVFNPQMIFNYLRALGKRECNKIPEWSFLRKWTNISWVIMTSHYDRNIDNTSPNTRKDSQMCFRSSVPMVPSALCASVTQRERAEKKQQQTNSRINITQSSFMIAGKCPGSAMCNYIRSASMHACRLPDTPVPHLHLWGLFLDKGNQWISEYVPCLTSSNLIGTWHICMSVYKYYFSM